ncbi:hypothetical protein MRX96_027743 [Rhipicephalus microplus]
MRTAGVGPSLHRLHLCSALRMVFSAVLLIICLFRECATGTEAPVAITDTGNVSGVRIEIGGRKIDAFLGIPYAEPPIGELRFQKPRPAKCVEWNLPGDPEANALQTATSTHFCRYNAELLKRLGRLLVPQCVATSVRM